MVLRGVGGEWGVKGCAGWDHVAGKGEGEGEGDPSVCSRKPETWRERERERERERGREGGREEERTLCL